MASTSQTGRSLVLIKPDAGERRHREGAAEMIAAALAEGAPAPGLDAAAAAEATAGADPRRTGRTRRTRRSSATSARRSEGGKDVKDVIKAPRSAVVG